MLTEDKKVWQLSDNELLALLRQRHNELATANALAGLVRVFDLIERKGQRAVWINEIKNIIALYSQNYCPGHEQHPYKDFLQPKKIFASVAPSDSDATKRDNKKLQVNVKTQTEQQRLIEEARTRANDLLPTAPTQVDLRVPKIKRIVSKIPFLSHQIFTIEHLRKVMDSDCTMKDLSNAIERAVSDNKIEREAKGVYRWLGGNE